MSPEIITSPRRPLSRREAAAYLQCSYSTLAKWALTPGKGPKFYRTAPHSGLVWYRVEDLDAFVESRAVRPS